MADKEMSVEDAIASAKDSHAKSTELLTQAGKHLDNVSDMLDHVESRMPKAAGKAPTPQRRPIAGGPDAAGNNRSSNADSWYGKD